jgi:hypothetical protein
MSSDPESVLGMRVRLLPAAVARLLLNPNVKEWIGTIVAVLISEKGSPAKYTIHFDEFDEHVEEPEDADVYEDEIEKVEP